MAGAGGFNGVVHANGGVVGTAGNGDRAGSAGADSSTGGTTAEPPESGCTSSVQCAGAACSKGNFTTTSECLQGACSVPATVACPFGECGIEGCYEPSIVFTDAASSPVRGDATAAATSQACPHGWLLIGVDITKSSNIVSQARLVCGAPQMSEKDPTRVLIEQTRELDWVGGISGIPEQGRCPANQVVVSFAGNNGLLLDQLRLYCSPLLRDGKTLVPDVGTAIPAIGGDGGTAFSSSECAEGSVASGGVIVIGVGRYVAGFGLRCKSPGLEWSPVQVQ